MSAVRDRDVAAPHVGAAVLRPALVKALGRPMSTRVCSGRMERTVCPAALQKLSAREAQHVNAGPWIGRMLLPSLLGELFRTCVAPGGIATPAARKASSTETRADAGASLRRRMIAGVAIMRRTRVWAAPKLTAS